VGSPDQYKDLRRGVREVCADFSDGYWRELDARREYPEAFIEAMTKSGFLGALIPEEYRINSTFSTPPTRCSLGANSTSKGGIRRHSYYHRERLVRYYIGALRGPGDRFEDEVWMNTDPSR
jgi:Acyl-CoA dehydrogenase, N-terminal domain